MFRVPVILSAVLLVGTPLVAAAQAPAATAPPLRQSLQALSDGLGRLPAGTASLDFARFRARTALSRLLALSANWPAESPLDYRANMDRQVRILDQAIAAGDVPRLGALIEALADDLEVKLEHCQNSGGKLGGSVVVNVRTLQGAQETGNWQVYYMPKVLESVGGSSGDRFPRLSSPTHETLVPGRYVMWVRDTGSDRTGERVVVKVGEGRKELTLDLPVPAGAVR